MSKEQQMTNQKQELIEKIIDKCFDFGEPMNGTNYIKTLKLEQILQDTLPNEQVVDDKKDEQYLCQSYVKGGKVYDCTCGKCF